MVNENNEVGAINLKEEEMEAQKVLTAQEKVKAVNKILKAGEPDNISKDNYSGYTGYSPQYIIDAMNAVMFGEWGFIEVENELVDKNDEGKPQLCIAQVQVWMAGVDFKPTAYGQARITRGDFGDARKSAQTDAIKKALSYFSVGNRAYHGKLEA